MKITFSILLISFVIQISAQDEIATTKIKLDQQMPEFCFTNEDGKTISITNYKGKTILIVFFATWCGPCRKELPHIQTEIFDKYKNNSKFKLLIFGREHGLEEVENFKQEQGYTMPFYPDKDRSIYSLFAEKYIPRTFLINSSGNIIFSETGFNNEKFANLKKLIWQNLQ